MRSRIHTYIILGIMLLLLPFKAAAQVLELQLKCSENGKVTPASGVRVYSFLDRDHALKGKAKMKDTYGQGVLSQRVYRYLTTATAEANGVVTLINTDNTAYLLIDALEYHDATKDDWALLIPVSSLNPKLDERGSYKAEYTIRVTDRGHTIREVESSAKRKGGRKSSGGKGILIGRDLTIPITVTVDSAYARDDARFVVSPFLVVPGENNDTVGFLTPRVLDGKEYHKSMYRRMGYNYNNDKLHPYTKSGEYMHLRRDTTITYHHTIYNIDRTRKYKGLGHVWYEDKNAVYHQEVVTVWDGNYTDPNRYLDWSSAQAELELDVEHYARVGVPEKNSTSQQYHLEFEKGDARLKTDSLSQSQVSILEKDVRTICCSDTEDRIDSVIIRGYSSPEGGYAYNESLALRRAGTVSDLFLSATRGATKPVPRPETKGYVISWNEVADYLETKGDSTSVRIAGEVRELSKSQNNNIDRTTALAKACPWYEMVETMVFPHLRRVEVAYKMSSYKVLEPSEIYQKYLDTSSNYHEGKFLRAYEYYNLMNTLYDKNDFEGLERISKAALNNRDLDEWVIRYDTLGSHVEISPDKRDTFSVYDIAPPTEPYQRKYALAAYYYVQSLLHRGATDVTILARDYMDFDRQGVAHEHTDSRQTKLGWWNEPAIVLTQVKALCANGNYIRAEQILSDHLDSNDPKLERMRVFLRALKCEYNVDEVRDMVATSSPMNFLVAWCGYATMAKTEADRKYGYNMALNLVNGNMEAINEKYPDIEEKWDGKMLESNDSRAQYMKALCRYKVDCPDKMQSIEASLFPSSYIYNPGYEENCWAAPMLEAIQLDRANLEYLKSDGNFNDAYRTLVIFFAERILQGADMDTIKREYDALYNKYSKVKNG